MVASPLQTPRDAAQRSAGRQPVNREPPSSPCGQAGGQQCRRDAGQSTGGHLAYPADGPAAFSTGEDPARASTHVHCGYLFTVEIYLIVVCHFGWLAGSELIMDDPELASWLAGWQAGRLAGLDVNPLLAGWLAGCPKGAGRLTGWLMRSHLLAVSLKSTQLA